MATALLAQPIAPEVPEVPEIFIQGVVERLINEELKELSTELRAARGAFEHFPGLVTAAGLPAHLAPFIEKGITDGIRPEGLISKDRMREINAKAPELAAWWYKRRTECDVDPAEHLAIDKDDTGVAIDEHSEAKGAIAKMRERYVEASISKHSVRMLGHCVNGGTPLKIGYLCDLIVQLESIRDLELERLGIRTRTVVA